MATVSDILSIARAELGTKESPANSNNVKYNTWYYGNAVNGSQYSWCMVFVQWVFDRAGFPLPFKTASCTALMNYAKEHNKWVRGNYKAGDVLLFQFDNDAYADHTGICEGKATGGYQVIEGNTSISGSQSNGGMVCRKIRADKLILGAYRPDFEVATKAPASTGTKKTTTTKKSTTKTGGTCMVSAKTLQQGSKCTAVKALQLLLIGFGYSCGNSGADGDFGAKTSAAVKKYQSNHSLTADGIVGAKTWGSLLE